MNTIEEIFNHCKECTEKEELKLLHIWVPPSADDDITEFVDKLCGKT